MEYKTYRCMLTGNRREVNTTTPKCLLIDIEPSKDLERDHCWVNMTQAIERLGLKGHNRPIPVEIEAKIVNYMRGGTTPSKTLHIRSIKRVKK